MEQVLPKLIFNMLLQKSWRLAPIGTAGKKLLMFYSFLRRFAARIFLCYNSGRFLISQTKTVCHSISKTVSYYRANYQTFSGQFSSVLCGRGGRMAANISQCSSANVINIFLWIRCLWILCLIVLLKILKNVFK